MASIEEVVASSMSINSRLPAQLEKALERNIVLRIGWTTNGDPVPKDGELGLCPNLPNGSKVRSLGYLGPFTAAFGQGGTYTHQGDVGSYLGAGNDGNMKAKLVFPFIIHVCFFCVQRRHRDRNE